jgi:fatty acid desaturase
VAQKTDHKENQMKRRNAVTTFLLVCAILATLLLTQIISWIVGAIAFAVALVLFGGLSRGFRGNDASSKLK